MWSAAILALGGVLLSACANPASDTRTVRGTEFLALLKDNGCSIRVQNARALYQANGFDDPKERLTLVTDLHEAGWISVSQGKLSTSSGPCGGPRTYLVFDRRVLDRVITQFEDRDCQIPDAEFELAFRSAGVSGPSEAGTILGLLLAAGVLDTDPSAGARLTDWDC